MKKDLSYNSNASPECIEAAKKLINLYRSITLASVESLWPTADQLEHSCFVTESGLVAGRLTGFATSMCLLCQSIDEKCDLCIYFCLKSKNCYCCLGPHKKSCRDIYNADSPRKLVNALKRRANHIENILKAIEKHNKI